MTLAIFHWKIVGTREIPREIAYVVRRTWDSKSPARLDLAARFKGARARSRKIALL